MKTFKGYLIEGGSTKASTDMEAVITVAYNGGLNKKSKGVSVNLPILVDAKVDTTFYKKNEPAAKKIAKAIKSKIKGGRTEMTHYGTGAGSLRTRPWKWVGNPTPKTDMYIGNSLKISLKAFGGSRIMSAKKGEALSTFHAAVDFMGENSPSEATKLSALLDTTLEEVIVPKKFNINMFRSVMAGRDTYKQNKVVTPLPKNLENDPDMQQSIADFNAIETLKPALKEDLDNFFSDNTEFTKWFVYEAATGETKFSDNKSKANWIVEFGFDGSSSIEKISNGTAKPTTHIDSMAETVVLRPGWKTPSGSRMGGKTFLALHGDIKSEYYPTFDSILAEEYKQFLNEDFNYLTEGKIWDKIVNFFKGIYNKAKAILSELTKRGIRAIYEFFGFEVEHISGSGPATIFSDF